jgi:hypothetical protein
MTIADLMDKGDIIVYSIATQPPRTLRCDCAMGPEVVETHEPEKIAEEVLSYLANKKGDPNQRHARTMLGNTLRTKIYQIQDDDRMKLLEIECDIRPINSGQRGILPARSPPPS